MKTLSLWGGKTLWEGHHLRRLRGKGGFGQVWEAVTATGEPVAMKFLRCDDAVSSPKELRNILAIRQLNHPNLLRTERVWSGQGYLVVSMELADGSLADLLEVSRAERGNGLPMDIVCHYLTKAARALDFLNARQHQLSGLTVGFQHCDVKPGNLLIVGDSLKLGDFGLVTKIAAPVVAHYRAGTTAYAAPEVFEGRLSDWTDQFALAVTYCELRSGRLPFPRSPSRFGRSYFRPEADLSILSGGEIPVIRRALARVPQDRWRTCGEMMTQLVAILDQEPGYQG
ncbi:MAG: serine/threonine protein kinase [Planctomycetes bacterium]|nr:serine/threonine protein kinase [Planctomycetota bacterium]